MKRLEMSERQFGITEVITGALTQVAGAAGLGYLTLQAVAENVGARGIDAVDVLSSMDLRAIGSWGAIAISGYFVQQVGLRRIELTEEHANR